MLQLQSGMAAGCFFVTVHGGGLAGPGLASPHATFFRWVLAAKPPAPSEKNDSRGSDGPRSPRWGIPLNAYLFSFWVSFLVSKK